MALPGAPDPVPTGNINANVALDQQTLQSFGVLSQGMESRYAGAMQDRCR